ncbi:MAG TPA: imidazoleglycerol-phosphate dehydratase HisB [Verrucomicrobiae bacterium]|jgi:imidazoleglycerol-phosphate dehydratase|nr:imidazoleglycerol-phosphate dehydratase HisB [Verrucomicrobiae bacterium]
MKSKRAASVHRKTSETDIQMKLGVDGTGVSKITTGIPFVDHMLTLFSKHGLFDLEVKAKGDLEVDIHHTNEDTGITLGQALTKALGDKKGIKRYGFFTVPMDEALVQVTLDISGRPSLHVRKNRDVQFSRLENYSFHDSMEFMKAFCQHAGINMHVEVIAGKDSHHIIEGTFKAMARALDAATQIDPRVKGIPSTKGSL